MNFKDNHSNSNVAINVPSRDELEAYQKLLRNEIDNALREYATFTEAEAQIKYKINALSKTMATELQKNEEILQRCYNLCATMEKLKLAAGKLRKRSHERDDNTPISNDKEETPNDEYDFKIELRDSQVCVVNDYVNAKNQQPNCSKPKKKFLNALELIRNMHRNSLGENAKAAITANAFSLEEISDSERRLRQHRQNTLNNFAYKKSQETVLINEERGVNMTLENGFNDKLKDIFQDEDK